MGIREKNSLIPIFSYFFRIFSDDFFVYACFNFSRNFKIIIGDPLGWGLVLKDSNTGKHIIKCFGEAQNTIHIYSVIGNGQNSKLLPLKSFVQNMQWLVNSVSSSFSKDLSHEVKAKDSTRKAKTKTKDFEIALEDSNIAIYRAVRVAWFPIHSQWWISNLSKVVIFLDYIVYLVTV